LVVDFERSSSGDFGGVLTDESVRNYPDL